MQFSTNSIIRARKHIEDFEAFAKKRMKPLQTQLDEVQGFSGYINRCEFCNIVIDDLYGPDKGLQVIMQYGFHSSGTCETLILPLDIITLADAEWDAYCKDHIQWEIDKKSAKNRQASQKAKENRKEQYLKLREEFEAVDDLD